jgi:general secretion pathway protein E
LASSLEAVLAQRLVRKICLKCKKQYRPDENLLKNLNNSAKLEPNKDLYHGTGCNECMQSGMKGRTGIFEMLRITDSLRELIATRPTTEQIIKAAPSDHVSMRHDGVEKVLSGITTPEEVFRVTQGIGEQE